MVEWVGRKFLEMVPNLCHAMINMKLLSKRQILESSKSKAFTDDNLNGFEMMEFVLDDLGNEVGKRRLCWLTSFSLLPDVFK